MLLITILIHEIGHLVFGLFSGYGFVHFEILGFSLEKINSGVRIRKYKNIPVGQCLMYPQKINCDPSVMILGGPIFNVLTGVVVIAISIESEGMVFKTILLCFASLNISLAVFNIFLGSDECDGKTFLEIRRSIELKKAFNDILTICRLLRDGRSYADMPEKLFECCLLSDSSSIRKEKAIHSYRYVYEKRRSIWNPQCVGEKYANFIEKNVKKVFNNPNDRIKVFINMLDEGKDKMYPGEYLSAARIMMILTEKEK